MNNLEQQGKAETIHHSIEELHTLLSLLEQQIQSGLFSTQPDLKSDEVVMLEGPSLLQADRSSP